MIFLESAFFGLIGGISQILPLGKDIIFAFFSLANQTFMGNPLFGTDSSSLFITNIGILAGIVLLFKDKLFFPFKNAKNLQIKNYINQKSLEIDEEEKITLLSFGIYIGLLLKELIFPFSAFLKSSISPLILWEFLAILLCIFSDNVKKTNKSLKISLLCFSLLTFLTSSMGISVILVAMCGARAWNIEKKRLFSFCIDAVFVSLLFETITCLIKSVITGFHFVWYSYVLCALFGFLGVAFFQKALKKAISKRNLKIYGYFHVVFILIMLYTLI